MKRPYWWSYCQKTTVIVRYRELQERELTSQTEKLVIIGFRLNKLQKICREVLYTQFQTSMYTWKSRFNDKQQLNRKDDHLIIYTDKGGSWHEAFLVFFFSSVTLMVIFLCSFVLCVKDISELGFVKTTLVILNSHKVLMASFLCFTVHSPSY